MVRTSLAAAAAGLLLLNATPANGQVERSAYHDYRIVAVAEGLIHPWSIAFLPGGDMLITERPGRLRIVRNGNLLPDPVPGTPEVVSGGQAGLLDVVPHPDFATNHLLYLSYSKPQEGEPTGTTAVIRGTFENDTFTPVGEVFEAVTQGRGHYGSRLAFDPEGHLFITVGDRQAPPVGDLAELSAHPAQDPTNHHGTVNRLNDDGSIPEDNPFASGVEGRPEIWSYGHRNPQGLAIHPETGQPWITEHGPQGGDEVNVPLPGRNYGWPVIGFGVNYRTGQIIHESTHREGMEQPVHIWVPSIGTSGLMFYTGDQFPEWQGNLFAGGMVGEQVARLTLEGDDVVAEETLVHNMGRVRDIRQGPDGYIYVAFDGDDDEPTAVVRLEPAN